ncbi:MAG TPA: KUP/HAK/KT family potassium transporter [Verrucomicrobiae bacterium]|nr:KUP/HAK/KT family potassium transporter [Verrucomicrobiae bacterium]
MQHSVTKRTKLGVAGLTLGALGVVYGDIGTSPLYAANEIFFGHAHVQPTDNRILGIISLILWTLIIVVAIKYVAFVLRADNEGEGGTFALFARLKGMRGKAMPALGVLLIIAAGLLYGDGTITPAISVLSAVEGLKVATQSFNPYVIPLTIAILTGLFAIQSRGTHKIGKLFGPITLIWLATIASLGVRQIVGAPQILMAFNPLYALRALTLFPFHQLLMIFGSLVLVVTGGEALYADMGHFGSLPIRISWFTVVMPCLMLNYLGQGAFLLGGKQVVSDNLFYSLVPTNLLYPVVILACMATIIASQALISGAFSLTAQGINLGLLPRLKIKQTHPEHQGQIYIPFINWGLFIGCVALVLSFKSSSNLANAYGLAESGVMIATTLSMIVVAHRLWKWKRAVALAVFVPILLIDINFLVANSLKFLQGGFVPLTIGCTLYVIMTTWQWGRHRWRDTLRAHSTMTMGEILKQKQAQTSSLDRSLLILSHETQPKQKADKAPALLQIFMDRYHLLPKHVITMTIRQTRRPYVDEKERYTITEFENNHQKGFSLLSITASFGFMEEPDVEQVIEDIAKNRDLIPDDDMKDWIIYVARMRVVAHLKKRHPKRVTRMRALLFSWLVINATPGYEYYGLGDDSRVSAELIPVRIS